MRDIYLEQMIKDLQELVRELAADPRCYSDKDFDFTAFKPTIDCATAIKNELSRISKQMQKEQDQCE